MNSIHAAAAGQARRNQKLLREAAYLGDKVTSKVLPLQVDIAAEAALTPAQVDGIEALQIEAARTAISSLASLAKIGELDHLGGGLELIPALTLTLAVTDYERVDYTIEHAHTSIGYFAALAAYGFVKPADVIDGFRRGLDIPGHVSWLPGGTQLNGGRLGVMVPVAVGQAIGKRATRDDGAWVVCHCGDAGWISGQALNGFNGADVSRAPVTFIMHRNGIQLSGSTRSVMDKDPRPVIESLGIRLLEIPSLHDTAALYQAYREGWRLAQEGTPNLIYPTGYRSQEGEGVVDLQWFGDKYGVTHRVQALAAEHDVSMQRPIWVPGSLMSFRDEKSMVECVFLVNELPGGEGHHDGHMKGRDEAAVLAEPMLQLSAAQQQALQGLKKAKARSVTTKARPAKGSANLTLTKAQLAAAKLPAAGDKTSPRSGSEAGYAAVAAAHAERMFVVSCDLDVSTKLGKAKALLAADHTVEMSIEEQAATLIADGLAMSGAPQLNVVSTFGAFFEGIAREGFDMWRYQRNLTGVNEGLNVTMHVSHVGACTGRDHFSGWGLDWINVGLTYLPYLHRFYAPADARAAFLAVVDLAAHYGGHVIGIPRDNLPVLSKQDGSGPLWEATDTWSPVTTYRTHEGAEKAILALGAPAYLAGEAADKLAAKGTPVDVHVVNGLPFGSDRDLERLLAPYPGGIVTVEDGFIGTPQTGVRGFAALVASKAADAGLPVQHVGITDPTTAPADGHVETWQHFGITAAALTKAVQDL